MTTVSATLLHRTPVTLDTSTTAVLDITTTGSGVDPTRTSTLESPEYIEFAPEVSAVAAQVLPNAQSWPTSPQAPEMIQALSDNLALMLQGSLTAEEAMQQTWDSWQSLAD